MTTPGEHLDGLVAWTLDRFGEKEAGRTQVAIESLRAEFGDEAACRLMSGPRWADVEGAA